MVVFEKKFVTLAEERWDPPFDGPVDSSRFPGLDAISFLQTSKPLPGAVSVTRIKTLFIDLTVAEEDLFSRCSATTRKGINRGGQKDGLVYTFWKSPSDEVIRSFHAFYSQFASKRGIDRFTLNNQFLYRDAGLLDISVMRTPEGQDLTWHAHIVDRKRVRQLHFASSTASNDQEFRYLAGRSNRFHHWKDILRFKHDGNVSYDFGGLYEGDADTKKLHINEFKESFGGTPAYTFNNDIPITPIGRAYLWTRKLYRIIRGAH